MNFLEDDHQEFFTPWVKAYQFKRSLENSKLYNSVTMYGKKRTPLEMLISTINGEAIEHHYLNIWSLMYDCKYSENCYLDLCCNGHQIEFKTFKDITNLPGIIDHLCNIPGRFSKYLMFFERKGSWSKNLQYRIAFVYDLECKEFLVIGKYYKNLDHVLFYIDSNLSRKCK